MAGLVFRLILYEAAWGADWIHLAMNCMKPLPVWLYKNLV